MSLVAVTAESLGLLLENGCWVFSMATAQCKGKLLLSCERTGISWALMAACSEQNVGNWKRKRRARQEVAERSLQEFLDACVVLSARQWSCLSVISRCDGTATPPGNCPVLTPCQARPGCRRLSYNRRSQLGADGAPHCSTKATWERNRGSCPIAWGCCLLTGRAFGTGWPHLAPNPWESSAETSS